MEAVPQEGRGEYVLAEEREVAATLREEDVQLVPPDSQITPVLVPPRKYVPACEESAASVCVDILLATIGLDEEFRAVLSTALQQDVELRDLLQDLVRAVARGRERDATDVILRMVRVLASERFRRAAAKVVGVEVWNRVKRRLYLRLAAALVPFAGWIYVGISVGISVYERWDRLVAAVKCNQVVARNDQGRTDGMMCGVSL